MRKLDRRLLGLGLILAGCGGGDSGDGDEGGTNAQVGQGDPDWQRRVAAVRAAASELSIMVDDAGVAHMAYTGSINNEEVIGHAWPTSSAFNREAVDGFGRGVRKAWVTGSTEPRLVYDGAYVSSVAFYAMRSANGWSPDLLEFQDESSAATGLWAGGRMLLGRLSGQRGEEATGYASVDVVRQGLVFNDRALPAASTTLGLGEVPPMLALGTDSSGTTVHIVYSAPNGEVGNGRLVGDPLQPFQIRYVTFSGSAFSEPETLTVADGFYSGLSLAVDADDGVHVSFLRYDREVTSGQLPSGFGVTLLSRAAGETTWAGKVVAREASHLARGSMAVASDGVVHMAYCTLASQGQCDRVVHGYETDAGWATETVQEGCRGLGEGATLALGSDDSVHVTYAGCPEDAPGSNAPPAAAGDGSPAAPAGVLMYGFKAP